jgi:hypothetical protein
MRDHENLAFCFSLELCTFFPFYSLLYIIFVLLPGFQKGRDIKASQGKWQGAVLAKKGQFASYNEKLEKLQNFTPFRVNKMFSYKF